MNEISLWLQKMGTLVSDRRAIVAVLAVIFTLIGVPYTADSINSQSIAAVVAIIQGVVALAVSLGVIKSWEARPPSGLQYKDVLKEFLASNSPEVQALKEMLHDAGIDLGS